MIYTCLVYWDKYIIIWNGMFIHSFACKTLVNNDKSNIVRVPVNWETEKTKRNEKKRKEKKRKENKEKSNEKKNEKKNET